MTNIRLIRPKPRIEHPEDVAKLLRALEGIGYIASDVDIQAAYREWLRVTYGQAWTHADGVTAAKFLLGMMESNDFLEVAPDAKEES